MMLSLNSNAQIFTYAEDNPIELGKVKWLRNYDEAQSRSEKENKPIFILFQEVPGCGNCTKYGQEILSHPLIIEAIEDEFVPLAIYNNVSGHDREVLKHFNEPTWNNPVVRIVNSNGAPVAKRVGNFLSKGELISQMINGLEKEKKNIPMYLTLLQQEFSAEENGEDEFYLSMYCFWTGEKEIANIEGVVGTEAGWMHGREVVKVNFDTKKTNEKAIALKAANVRCADQVFSDVKPKVKIPFKKVGNYRKDNQDKYYLLQTKYKSIPMTELQKSKVNSAIGSRQKPERYLSPRQIKMFKSRVITEVYVEKEFVESWYSAVGR